MAKTAKTTKAEKSKKAAPKRKKGAAKNSPSPSAAVSDENLLHYYRQMLLIRRFEEKAGQLYGMGLIGGFCHLYIGQEAVVVGMMASANKQDSVITSYRDHGHMLACDMDLKGVMAELTGRRGGYSKGKGGSMHMFSREKNFFGGHGIVGAQVPIGTGLAFAHKYKKDGGVSHVYFGDGAANQGVLMETLNVTSLWKLPMFFICEHNGFSKISPAATVASGEIADRARRLYPRSRRQRDRVPAASGGRQRRGGGRLCAAPGCRRAPLMMQRHHGAARS